MDIKQLEQYIVQSDLGIDTKQAEAFLMHCNFDDEHFNPEELLGYIRKQVLDFRRLMAYYRCAMMEIETKFNVINEDFSCQYERNPIQSIKSRLKEPTSIRDKMLKHGYIFNAESIEENLFDVAGVRVICSFVDDVYRIADARFNKTTSPSSAAKTTSPIRKKTAIAACISSSRCQFSSPMKNAA